MSFFPPYDKQLPAHMCLEVRLDTVSPDVIVIMYRVSI